MTEALRIGEALFHEPDAAALAAQLRLDGERPEHQPRLAADQDRPEAQGPDHAPFGALARKGDIAKLRHRMIALAQALRGFRITAGTEGKVEQCFDGRPVLGPLGFDFKHRNFFQGLDAQTGSTRPLRRPPSRSGVERTDRAGARQAGSATAPFLHSSSLRRAACHPVDPSEAAPREGTGRCLERTVR